MRDLDTCVHAIIRDSSVEPCGGQQFRVSLVLRAPRRASEPRPPAHGDRRRLVVLDGGLEARLQRAPPLVEGVAPALDVRAGEARPLEREHNVARERLQRDLVRRQPFLIVVCHASTIGLIHRLRLNNS